MALHCSYTCDICGRNAGDAFRDHGPLRVQTHLYQSNPLGEITGHWQQSEFIVSCACASCQSAISKAVVEAVKQCRQKMDQHEEDDEREPLDLWDIGDTHDCSNG